MHDVRKRWHHCAVDRGGVSAGPSWAPKLINKKLPSTVVAKIWLTPFVLQTGAKNGAPKTATKALFFERFSRHHCLAKMAASCFLLLRHSGSNAHCHARPEHILHELARAYHDLARARFASRSQSIARHGPSTSCTGWCDHGKQKLSTAWPGQRAGISTRSESRHGQHCLVPPHSAYWVMGQRSRQEKARHDKIRHGRAGTTMTDIAKRGTYWLARTCTAKQGMARADWHGHAWHRKTWWDELP